MSVALVVSECLNDHGLQIPMFCKLCNDASKTVVHVLFECNPARAAWRELHILLPHNGFSTILHKNIEFRFNLMKDCDVVEIL